MSKNGNNTTLESTNRLLKVVIGLLSRKKDEQLLTLRQQIALLDGLGLRPIEIAEILNRNQSYVGKELVGIRKSKKSEE